MVSDFDAGGTLQKSYVMHSPEAEVARILADIAGTNPETGTTRYYAHDHLGSTRNLYSAARQTIGTYWYTPYGDLHNQAGVALESLGGAFTGKPWDPDAQLYYFPYRYYSPKNARWLTRDPLGMVDGPNVYAYVRGNPVNLIDPLGLFFGFARDYIVRPLVRCYNAVLVYCGLKDDNDDDCESEYSYEEIFIDAAVDATLTGIEHGAGITGGANAGVPVFRALTHAPLARFFLNMIGYGNDVKSLVDDTNCTVTIPAKGWGHDRYY